MSDCTEETNNSNETLDTIIVVSNIYNKTDTINKFLIVSNLN